MEAFGFYLLLLAVVAAVTLLAARIGVPYPIPMVIAGLAIGLVPGVPRVELDPELVLALFLPPILFSAAFFLSPRELWRNVRPISLLAVGLVLTTTVAVAAVLMAVAPQLGWPVAIALGAIVSPPDAIAATSIARQLNLPRRLVIIFEGESLVNDATALTVYRLAVLAAVGTGTLDLGGAAISFVFVAAGGAVVGLVVGWVASWLLSLLEDPPVEVLISLLVPFTAYLPAERLGVSGVMATVAAGLLLGFRAPRIMRSDTRLLGTGTWKMVIFVVNGLAFLLIGLQLPTVIADLGGYEAGELVAWAAAVSLTVIVVRLVWIYPATYLPRWLIPSVARRDPAPPARVPLILGWGGMRGAVSLFAALALPLTTDAGDPFPGRGLLIFLTFTVILVTLIGQGLTLPALIRFLGVVDDGTVEHEETHARAAATAAALVRLEELRSEVPGHLPLIDQLKERYEHRSEHLVHDDGHEPTPEGPDDMTPEEVEELEHDEIRRAVISAERLAVLEMRDRGEISDDALRAVERDLDLDELRREA
ncbi:MAG: monovalent cation/hydrogen antiporter [Gaiellales bacterium]|nr:monovalent cation/hydrogen antiporter [Gaiellales bacterium]